MLAKQCNRKSGHNPFAKFGVMEPDSIEFLQEMFEQGYFYNQFKNGCVMSRIDESITVALNEKLKEIQIEEEFPSLSAVAVVGDETVWTSSVGYSHLDTQRTADAHTFLSSWISDKAVYGRCSYQTS